MLTRALLALVLAAALASGLAACGDDDEPEGGGPATAAATSTAASASTAPSSEEAYAEALRDAAGALTDLGGAVVSGAAPQDVQQSITAALADWQGAIERAGAADLAEPALAGQRDDLVAASPQFVAAWTAVADEWASGRADGLLELVQQRAPIAAGARALSDAVEGALEAAGEEARSRLEGVGADISSALEQIQSP